MNVRNFRDFDQFGLQVVDLKVALSEKIKRLDDDNYCACSTRTTSLQSNHIISEN